MPNYTSPGVYVEELSTGAKPIQAVGTSTAGFVGEAPSSQARRGKAVAIGNWQQFFREFCGGGTGSAASTPLALAVFGFFQNGGSRCWVVNVKRDDLAKGLEELGRIDEIAIVAAPGWTDIATYSAVLSHCETKGDRVAVLDMPREVDDLEALTRVATAPVPASAAPAGAARTTAAPADDDVSPGLRPPNSDRGFGAVYFPWIVVRDPLAEKNVPVPAPPSGHVAGIYARSDATRGVHKAPANETVRGALNVTYRVSREEQGELNRMGVNCIRFFAREGIRVWGGRTLAQESSEWRYINVRRLFNMIEESIAESTRWVVFEPNDATLWKSIKRDVTAFLMRLWRDGALMGATPEEAFFVQCDAETNPPEVVDAGQVVTVVGLAPVKPAEFIIFRIGQTSAGAEIQS